jgi:hypothetical protein
MSLMLPPEPTTEVEELPSAVAPIVPSQEQGARSGGPFATLSAKFKDLTSRLPLDKIPTPLRNLARPILFGSLGLHALLLFAPMPGEQAKKPEKKEAPVKITQIPTGKFDKKTNIPKILPKVAPPALPKVAVQSSRPALTIPNPAAPAPQASASSAPKPAADAPPVQPPPSVTPAPPSPTNSEKTTTDPFADFPKYAPASANCFGKGGDNCLVATADLLTVSTWYNATAKAKGFELKKLDDSNAGASVFEVTKGGKVYFLSLVADASSTVILLDPSTKLTDLSKLKDGPVDLSPPGEYTELLGQLLPSDANQGGNQAHADQFPDPNAFFSDLTNDGTLRDGVSDTPKFGPSDPATFFATLDASGLKGIFDEVSPVGQYGGGNLYKLKKGNKIFFMSLVPKKGGGSTIVVTWNRDPTKP